MSNPYLDAFKKTQLRKCQLKQLAILETIDGICKRHGIEYWLDGGTLLGAARHKGFIPWDDDIDIAMRLEDLRRFLAVAPGELPPRYSLADGTEKHKPIVKVFDLNSFYVEPKDDFEASYHKCLYVDIFPFIDYPNVSRGFVKRFFRQYSRSYSILHCQHYYSWRSCAELFYFGAKCLFNKAVCRLAFAFCGKGKYFGNIMQNNGYGIMHANECLMPLTTIEFEGRQFPAPADSDAYLRDLYGDYMAIPPADKQKIHSAFILAELDGEG